MCERRMALHVYQQPSHILSMLESNRIIDEYTNFVCMLPLAQLEICSSQTTRWARSRSPNYILCYVQLPVHLVVFMVAHMTYKETGWCIACCSM